MAESKAKYSEPEYVQKQNKTQCPFWRATIAERTPPEVCISLSIKTRTDWVRQTHDLLETYSGIPRDQHDGHVHRTRDRLWEIRQYPCTGGGGWLKPQICLSNVYPEIVARAKAGETVVDIGTFIGHDLRRLVVDGAPSDHLWGIDIANHFDVGFDFFNDRERWKGRFVEADFLALETNPALEPLRGKTDIIFVMSVLHQFDWIGQVRAAVALTKYTKPGSLIAGIQMGQPVAGEVVMQGLKVPLYIHTPESFAKLWDEVGASTGTRWETQAWPQPWEHIGVDSADMKWMGLGVQLLEFAVRRIA